MTQGLAGQLRPRNTSKLRIKAADVAELRQYWARVSGVVIRVRILRLECAGVWLAESVQTRNHFYLTIRDLLRPATPAGPREDWAAKAAGEKEDDQ